MSEPSSDNQAKARLIECFENKDILICHQCGACSSICPMMGKSPLRIRDLVYLATMDRKEVFDREDQWYCTVCYLCHERCPQGIHLVELVMALRTYSIQDKGAPQFIQNAVKLFESSGMAFPTGGFTRKLREKLGLEPLNTCANDEAALKEVLTIAKETGLLKEADQ